MQPRDLFGVAVRGAGLWLILRAVDAAYYEYLNIHRSILFAVMNIHPSEEALAQLGGASALENMLFYLIAGILFIMLAPLFVRLVYGKQVLGTTAAGAPAMHI